MVDVTIDRRRSNALVFGTLCVGWIVAAAAVESAFWSDVSRKPSWQGWLSLGLAGAFFVGVLVWLVVYSTTRLAGRAQFSADVKYSTWSVERRLAWNEIGRVVFKEQNVPLPSKFSIKFIAVDGTRFDVYAGKAEAEKLLALVQQHPLARGWPGQPLPAATAWALVGLGTIALLVGLGFGIALWQELRNAAAVPPRFSRALLLAVGIPAIGMAGIGLGGFHLVRRPIVLLPGVFQIREGDATSPRDLVRRLFGRID